MCIANAQRPSPGVLFSKRASADFGLSVDPDSAAWKNAPRVVTDTDRFGERVPNARTEIRSRWTKENLYFLFISHYETLYLKPEPSLEKETFGLWDYDVVEVFVSSDLKNIHSYKEFEVLSPSIALARTAETEVSRRFFNLVLHNCMQDTYNVLTAYGANLPRIDKRWAFKPNDWYNLLSGELRRP